MPSICLDIDGVVSDICAGLNYELEVKRGIFDVDYSEWLIGSYEDDLTKEIFGSQLFWKNLKPFDDAWYQINKWWSLGYDIHFVTARLNPAGKDILPVWLEDWRIQYSNFHFAAAGAKIDIISGIDPIFVIEDNPHEVAVLNHYGVPCFLRRAWYNSEFWEDMDSVGSLLEISV
jgi:hypothetical protein